jgi:hypothetical protein
MTAQVIKTYPLAKFGQKEAQQAHAHTLDNTHIIHDGTVYQLDGEHGFEVFNESADDVDADGNDISVSYQVFYTNHVGFSSFSKCFDNYLPSTAEIGHNGALIL